MPRFTALIVTTSCLLLLTACNTPDSEHRGRVEVSETTKGEQTSNQVFPAALVEFADQVAADLPQKIAQIPELRTGDRATVLVGDINNKTYVVSSNDFEMVRSRIRNSVLQSDFVRSNVVFVENRARMGAVAQREGVGINPNTGTTGPGSYDPQTTWALNGDFYRIHRDTDKGDSNQYYMEFQLVNFATNQIVALPKYELKQWRP